MSRLLLIGKWVTERLECTIVPSSASHLVPQCGLPWRPEKVLWIQHLLVRRKSTMCTSVQMIFNSHLQTQKIMHWGKPVDCSWNLRFPQTSSKVCCCCFWNLLQLGSLPTAISPHKEHAPCTETTPTGSSTLRCQSSLSTQAVRTAPTAPITSASHGLHSVQIPGMEEIRLHCILRGVGLMSTVSFLSSASDFEMYACS